MDNLGSHKGQPVRAAIERAGATLLYLPPYSPDLNPIEQLFAKLKALLRKAATRSLDTLWAAVGDLLTRFKPGECANYSQSVFRLDQRSSWLGARHSSGASCLPDRGRAARAGTRSIR